MPTVLVAVDFGTTYSGLAFSDPSQRSSEPILISDWGRGATSSKVPTEIRFEGPGKDQYKWGFQIKRGEERHSWFKLGLDPENRQTGAVTSLSRALKDLFVSPPDYQRTTEDIVASYLTALRRHTLKHIERLYGNAVVKDCRFEWIITVPAVWSDLAKKKTRTAALKAGMGNDTSLQMTSEPEAAAVYALKALDPHHIKVGESVVICDAGGGTVDLITYKMKSVTHPYSVEESAIGGGSQCGSTFLNRRFEEFLKNKLKGKHIPDNAMEVAMKYFEREGKRNFGSYEDDDEDEQSFEVPLPGVPDDPSAGVCAGFLDMTYGEMKEVFRPVIAEVLQLVKKQISEASKNGPISAVILVGGFGESVYLHRRIKEAVKPIPVLQPPNAWTAVVRGAVMKGKAQNSFAPSWNVTSRYCRGNYGFDVNTIWLPGMRSSDIFLDEREGVLKCPIAKWAIKRGDKLQESSSKSFALYRKIALNSPMVFNTSIYYSPVEGSQAPQHMDDTCREHVVLRADLSSIPKSNFPLKLGNNCEFYYEVNFSIEATFYSAEFKFELMYQGKKYGGVTANWLDK